MASRYMTDNPKTILHSAGCGRMNGPLGNASTDMMRKKTSTLHRPANTLER